MTSPSSHSKTWIDYLDEEDLIFVKAIHSRFRLAQGSGQNVSDQLSDRPLRLDRLITKIQVVDDQQTNSPFEKLLRSICRRQARFRDIQTAPGRTPRRTGG